jgi:hypothetical protein
MARWARLRAVYNNAKRMMIKAATTLTADAFPRTTIRRLDASLARRGLWLSVCAMPSLEWQTRHRRLTSGTFPLRKRNPFDRIAYPGLALALFPRHCPNPARTPQPRTGIPCNRFSFMKAWISVVFSGDGRRSSRFQTRADKSQEAH